MARSPRKAFTLMEMLVTVLLLGILTGIAIVNYRGYIDRVAILNDETNQKILHAAIRIQATETGTVAGSIGELRPDVLDRAYAMVGEGKRPFTMLAFWGEAWRGCFGASAAEATTFLPAEYYNRRLETIVCRSDSTPPTGFTSSGGQSQPTGGTSYAISPLAQNKPLSWLMNLTGNGDQDLIVESDIVSGTPKMYRHRRGTVGVTTKVNGKHVLDTGI